MHFADVTEKQRANLEAAVLAEKRTGRGVEGAAVEAERGGSVELAG